MEYYSIRDKCIFCNNKLNETYFKKDYYNYLGHYSISMDYNKYIKIPFNIFICSNCKTIQNKYLGNLNEIYKINHADSTGYIMNSLHEKIVNLIVKYNYNIKNIIEIGSSHGNLADLLLDKIQCKYNIM